MHTDQSGGGRRARITGKLPRQTDGGGRQQCAAGQQEVRSQHEFTSLIELHRPLIIIL